jgi:hypothetical protein
VNPNHQSPLEVIQQAVRDIVSLHRTTVGQLSELIRVQAETTQQFQAVSEAMREVGMLFRDTTAAQARVSEILNVVAKEIERVAESDAAIRQAILALAEQYEQAVGQLAGINVLLRQLLREHERVALAALAREIEQCVPSLFCRGLTDLRWGVPGTFYEEIGHRLTEAALDLWLDARIAVQGTLRQSDAATRLWVLLWIVPELTEAALDEVRGSIRRLGDALGPVLPAVAPLRLETPLETAIARGVLVISDGRLQGWEAALAHWGVGGGPLHADQ